MGGMLDALDALDVSAELRELIYLMMCVVRTYISLPLLCAYSM
jgi:hypothetical protein